MIEEVPALDVDEMYRCVIGGIWISAVLAALAGMHAWVTFGVLVATALWFHVAPARKDTRRLRDRGVLGRFFWKRLAMRQLRWWQWRTSVLRAADIGDWATVDRLQAEGAHPLGWSFKLGMRKS